MWRAIDDRNREEIVVNYPYFEQPDALIWDEPGTYVQTDHEFTATASYEWNHGLGEMITALIRHGMRIDGLVEHQSIPWEALPGHMILGDDGEYRLKSSPERLPLTFTLKATRIA